MEECRFCRMLRFVTWLVVVNFGCAFVPPSQAKISARQCSTAINDAATTATNARAAVPPLPSPGDDELDRRGTWSRKWTRFGGEREGAEYIVPLWVADMDFQSPPEVVEAVKKVASNNLYGYTDCPALLAEATVARLQERHGFGSTNLDSTMLRWIPGLLPGLNHVIRARQAMDASTDQISVAVAAPIYAPFLAAPVNCGAELVKVPLARRLLSDDASSPDSRIWHYEIDNDALEGALARPECKVLLWCSPHNPTGRVWTREELKLVAELCVTHDVTLLSDEVWADLVLSDHQVCGGDESTNQAPYSSSFVGMAALCTEVPGLEERLVVLCSPSKAFNVAALDVAVAAIPAGAGKLRRAFRRAGADAAEVTAFGYAAALAVYGPETKDSVERWRLRLAKYLHANREVVERALLSSCPHIKLTRPEASYLTWIDCVDSVPVGSDSSSLAPSPFKHFLENGVALTDGTSFGDKNAVRLNFGTHRDILDEGLARMDKGLSSAVGTSV